MEDEEDFKKVSYERKGIPDGGHSTGHRRAAGVQDALRGKYMGGSSTGLPELLLTRAAARFSSTYPVPPSSEGTPAPGVCCLLRN